jgi:hypothetical protein
MYSIITTDDDCDLSLISVKKPYQVSHGIYVFDIAYDKKPLLIQTPICTIPYSYSIFDNNAFKIDVVTCMKNFICTTDRIHQHILNKIRVHDSNLLNNKQAIDYIKDMNDGEARIRLRNTSTKNIMAFDRNSTSIPVSTIQSFDRVICLYQLQRVVVQNDMYMFSTCLCQVKRLNVSLRQLDTCMIKTSDNVEKYGDVDLTKYNKMKQLGIPIEAIEHKMIMEGLKKDCIKYWMDFQTLKLAPSNSQVNVRGTPLPPPPPPPPPIPIPSSFPTQNGGPSKMQGFLKDIMSNNFVLKKRDDSIMTPLSKVNTKLVGKIASKFKDDFGYEPPTLQDILNARSSLKKVSR